MFKLPFSFKSSDSSHFLTVDIGADILKVLAFKVNEDESSATVEIVGVSSEPLADDLVRGGVVLDVEGVSSALKTAVLNATSEIDGNVKNAIFGLSGDLSLCILTTVKVIRGDPNSINEAEVDAIHKRIHEEAQSQAFNDIMESSGNSDINIELITSSVIYTKLDGEKVVSLIGKHGQEVEIALFTAFTPSFNTEILAEVAKEAGLKILAVGSEMYSLVRSLQASKGDSFDGIILDMGSDITDIGIIFGGGIVTAKSLPIGGMHITHQISQKTGLSYFGAEEKKLAYSYGNLNDTELISVHDSLQNVLKIWLSGVELTFSEFTGIKTFASKIYLVGGSVQLPDILELLSKEPWTKSIPFKSPPEFIKLSMDDLSYVTDSTGKANTLSYVLPASLSIVYLEMNGYLDE